MAGSTNKAAGNSVLHAQGRGKTANAGGDGIDVGDGHVEEISNNGVVASDKNGASAGEAKG